MNDTVSAGTGQQPLAQARAEELDRLRGAHAAQASAASAFELARALWRNGQYESAVTHFTHSASAPPVACTASPTSRPRLKPMPIFQCRGSFFLPEVVASLMRWFLDR